MTHQPANSISIRRDRVTDAALAAGDLDLRGRVCVIGTGAGGAVAAYELARRGLDVVVLEEGPYVTGAETAGLTPLACIKKLYRDAGMTFTMGTPGILIPYGRCVGGSTAINSGSAFRMDQSTFEGWRARHGLPGLEWTDMVRLFDDVERRIKVAPVPEAHLGENGRMIRAGTEALGLAGEIVTRNAHGCLGRGRCYLGCPEDAKQATHLNYVPAALEAGARLLTNCKADRITVRGTRRIELLASAGAPGAKRRRVTVSCEAVVVACGAVHSPGLLAASGLTRGSRHAGRHLRLHPASRVIGFFDREIRGHIGVPQSYHVTGLMDRGLVPEGVFVPPSLIAPAMPGLGREHLEWMLRYPSLGLFGYRIIDRGEGEVKPPIAGIPRVAYDLSREDTVRMVDVMRRSAEILFAAGAQCVLLPVHGRGRANSMDEVTRLLTPEVRSVDIELAAYHPQGTLRMGEREADSVTRSDGSLRGVDGVWVADGSLMPDSPIVNPQVTIMALAAHVGARAAASLGGARVEG